MLLARINLFVARYVTPLFIKGYEPGTSFRATGEERTTVPRLQCRGETGGDAAGVLGAVRFALVPARDISSREPDLEGGADPEIKH